MARKTDKAYRRQWREIRKYVDKEIDARNLNASDKRFITKAWNLINGKEGIERRPNRIYRARNSERLKAAQELGGNPKGIKLKVAFIPGEANTKIKWRGNRLITRTNNIEREFIPFDKRRLVENPDAEIARVLGEAKGKAFSAGLGIYEGVGASTDKNDVAASIRVYLQKYANAPDFVRGIVAYNFHNQRSIQSFAKERDRIRSFRGMKAHKRARKHLREGRK